jgi:predicted metal-dependent hydrolase
VNASQRDGLLDERIRASIFKQEVHQWAERIGVQPREVHIRSMTRKWASCSSSGRLTFDSALMEEPTDFRNEVVVHELLHLKVPNHGRLFRNLVRAHLGVGTRMDYADKSVKASRETEKGPD